MVKKTPKHRTKTEQIHYTMSRIRGKNTKIEIMLRKALWHSGIRYRKNYKVLPGTPDIAITKYKIAIFCDGEFWHGKSWSNQREKLRSNREYWIPKIEKNMDRDQKTFERLEHMGWYVMRFWGKEIEKNLGDCVREVKEAIIQSQVDSSDMHYSYENNGFYEETESFAAERSPEYMPDRAKNI